MRCLVLPWFIELDAAAQDDLRRLGSAERVRILRFLDDRLAKSPDPRKLGARLSGTLADQWRYRVGNYRLLAQIEDRKLLVLVVKIAHRSVAYR